MEQEQNFVGDYVIDTRSLRDDYLSRNDNKTNLQLHKKEIDWEQRRYEIAKAALIGELSAPIVPGVNPLPHIKDIISRVISITDALIEELKK